MSKEYEEIQVILATVKAKIETREPFNVVLVQKKPDGSSSMITVKYQDIKRIRVVLLSNGDSGLEEIAIDGSIDSHLFRGDKLAIAVHDTKSVYYVMYPVDFNRIVSSGDNSFNFVLGSFKLLHAS